MVVLWTSIVALTLLTAIGSALIALRLHYQMLDKTRQEREAWQQAQEGRQRTWEVRQGKHILDAEKKLADQFKELRREWRDWNIEAETRLEVEQELARLPHIEDVELSLNAPGSSHQQPERWQPPAFYRADLGGRDLSYRYMGRADLREAQLPEANLYMADLTGASLTGANLEHANLVGANLSGADLREANLSGANLMVTDLHNAALHGASLLGARNLSPEQLQMALYDKTTSIDAILDAPQAPAFADQPASSEPASKASLGQNEAENTPGMLALSEPVSSEAPVSFSEEDTVKAKSIGPGARQRASSPKQPATAEPVQSLNMPAQTPMVERESEKHQDENRKLAEQEDEISEREDPPSSKIIQLQARTPKAVQLQASKNRNTTKRHGQRKGKSRTDSVVGSNSRESGDQQAQAN